MSLEFNGPDFRESLDAEALENYKSTRANGADEDSPSRPFPQDGKYDWVHEEDIASYLKLPPHPRNFRRRYTEGPDDKAWMEERDRNYIARRAREESQQQAGAGAEADPSADGGPTLPAL